MPQLDQCCRQERQTSRLVRDLVDQGLHERGIDPHAGASGRKLDSPGEPFATERSDQDMVRGERSREVGEFRTVAVVIGPDDDDHDEMLRPSQRRLGESFDERRPLLLVVADREHLFELIDDE